MSLRPRLAALLAAVAIGAIVPGYSALAMPASCQQDLDGHAGKRLEIINRINNFKKKRPTATQACGVFRQLTDVEAKMLKWMQDNKDWCQLPDPFVNQFQESIGQGVKARDQTCAAAKKEQQMQRQGGAGGGAPAPGSGIRLPQGAL